MAVKASSGGGSTINGVVYQLLWSLLRVAKLKINQVAPDPLNPAAPNKIVVILEPRGGGGDLRLQGKNDFEVEQLKARSDGSTWALREVIEEVFPDLFLASVKLGADATRFRFVTEGRMGGWSSVYEGFFRTLHSRKSSGDVISRLDVATPLKFTRHPPKTGTPFFQDPVTEGRLFLKIAEVIGERPATKSLGLNQAALHEAVWRMLCGFEFDGNHPVADVQDEIDSILLAIVDSDKDIPVIRDHLAVELAKAAIPGDAEIEAASFLKNHGLDAIPLSDWVAHRERAAQVLNRALERRNYRPAYDIRRSDVGHIPARRVLAVTGESGTGKSWMVNALADASTSSARLPVLIESTGRAEDDLQKISEVFWYDVHDGDEALHLSRVSRRLRIVAGDKADIGLNIFIDGVESYSEAARLVQNDWIGWNCSLVLSCRPGIAASLTGAFPNQIDVIDCQNFSWEQLHELLDRKLGIDWPAVREDVREVLKVPLLAGIYCDEFGESGWLPTSEYELYERVWRRVTEQKGASPLDAARIESLARSVLAGDAYPWTGEHLMHHGVEDAVIERLISNGWLVRTSDERFRVFHNRLLHWSVAKALSADVVQGRIAIADVAKQIASIVEGASPQNGIGLGFVPMDVLWLLGSAKRKAPELSSLLAALEATSDRYAEVLYDELVPTLGAQMADSVFARYCEFEGLPWERKRIGRALRKIAGDRIVSLAEGLIKSTDPRKQLLGIHLIEGIPCPTLLDDLWRIHLEGQSHPEKFGDELKSWHLYRETFDALKMAVEQSPDWLVGAISAAGESERVEDLAWLVANLADGGNVWLRVKKELFAKISADKPRSLLSCIGRHKDLEKLSWAKQWISADDLTVGPLALHTVSRLDPDVAVECLPDSDPDDLAMSSRWAFAELYARRPEMTHAKMIEWMRGHPTPWKVGLIFAECVNDLTAEELNLLLDDLEKILAREAASEKCGQHGLHREFGMLSRIAAPHLLDVLQGRAGKPFETSLRDYLIRIGPRRGIWMDSAVRDPAIQVLHLIGGGGLAEVVNAFLEIGDQYAREDAIIWAAKRPNDKTIRLLKDLVISDEQWNSDTPDPHPINQNSAIKALVSLDEWEAVAEGLTKWGMKTSSDLIPSEEPIVGPWINQLRVGAEQAPTAGKVVALGTFGEADDCTLIRNILDSCDRESEIAHACIIALEALGDRSNEGVERVAPHLQIEKHHYSATRMLTAAGNPTAWAALFEDIKRKLDFITALNLVNLSEYADQVIELVLERWPTYRGSDQISMLRLFITKIRDEKYRDRILRDRDVRDFIHRLSTAAEGSFWFTGSKAKMIECLSLFNPAAAFAAACRCLADSDVHDRELYPSLLVQIDRDKAVDWLFDHATKEKSPLVRHAIGRSLEEQDLNDRILVRLESEHAHERQAACFIAGWTTPDQRIEQALNAKVEESSVEVVAAALVGRRMREDRSIATKLLERLEAEADLQRKSIWLDALIGIADPGGEGDELSPLLARALKAVGRAEAQAGVKRIEKRRKKLAEKLKKEKV